MYLFYYVYYCKLHTRPSIIYTHHPTIHHHTHHILHHILYLQQIIDSESAVRIYALLPYHAFLTSPITTSYHSLPSLASLTYHYILPSGNFPAQSYPSYYFYPPYICYICDDTFYKIPLPLSFIAVVLTFSPYFLLPSPYYPLPLALFLTTFPAQFSSE